MYKYSAKGIYQIECLVNHKKYKRYFKLDFDF